LVAFISKRPAFSISFRSFSSFKPSHSNTASRCGLPISTHRPFLQTSSRGASDQASALVDHDSQIILTSIYSQSNACHLCVYYYCISLPHSTLSSHLRQFLIFATFLDLHRGFLSLAAIISTCPGFSIQFQLPGSVGLCHGNTRRPGEPEERLGVGEPGNCEAPIKPIGIRSNVPSIHAPITPQPSLYNATHNTNPLPYPMINILTNF
jgi:hypothetical protein